jgi:ferredoxin
LCASATSFAVANYGRHVELASKPLQTEPHFRIRNTMPTVEFLDAGKVVDCGQYANLRKAAMLHGVEVYKGLAKVANCHGNGLCGTCVMEIVEGVENLSLKTLREKFRLKGKPANYRLSCQCQVMGDVACITAPALDNQPVVATARA